MKFVVSQVSAFVNDPSARKNLGALRSYLYVLVGIIVAYSLLFHVIMEYEGQNHTWLTGFYWTLTVMSTLGFGDITFESDLGRLFSLIVLVSGIVLLLIMLPFAFIRYFYAPWLEAQIKAKVSRRLPNDVTDHVIICRYDTITNGLIRKLTLNKIPYCIIEPDTNRATELREEGLHVIAGEVDNPETYRAVNIESARLLFANDKDATNTNIILTVRSLNETIPIAALAEDVDSLDIFALSGATYPIALKTKLGENLATRISTGVGTAHEVGRFKDLIIVEFLVHDTPLAGVTLRDANLRVSTGVNVVGIWENGKLNPVKPDVPLSETSVPVAVGNKEQVKKLNEVLGPGDGKKHQVLVVGGGKVGRSTAKKLKQRGVHVKILDLKPELEDKLEHYCHEVIIGNAADLQTLVRAGINQVSAAALTTNDDAQNIHLAVYFRRLQPQLSIVSRITRERNIEAIYRAGADFVLSYASLGCEFINAYMLGREPVMVGEGADFFYAQLPDSLNGKTLSESGIGAQTGLVVIAIEEGETTLTNPAAKTVLTHKHRLLMLGTNAQREAFSQAFE
ncbi:MAG: NAD-binding protein [Verrucomicrobiota bacterium]